MDDFTKKFVDNFKKLKADFAEFNLGEPKLITEFINDSVLRVKIGIPYPPLKEEVFLVTDFIVSDAENLLTRVLSELCEIASNSIHYKVRLDDQGRKDFLSRIF